MSPIYEALIGGAITGLFAVLGNFAVGAYYSGKYVERLNSHGNRLNALEEDVKDHETRISHLEGRR